MSSYLERVMSHLTDPSEIAIVTYALSMANSPTKEAAFYLLDSIKREGGKLEWFYLINQCFNTVKFIH